MLFWCDSNLQHKQLIQRNCIKSISHCNLSSKMQKNHINADQLFLAGDSAGINSASPYVVLLTSPNISMQSGFIATIEASQLKELIL